MDLGPAELIIILLIVALLFGPGRISKLGGELGAGLHEFRKGLQGERDAQPDAPEEEPGNHDLPDAPH